MCPSGPIPEYEQWSLNSKYVHILCCCMGMEHGLLFWKKRKRHKFQVYFFKSHSICVTIISFLRNTVYSRENETFQMNISPPSSGSRSTPSKKPAEAGSKLSAVPCSPKILGRRQISLYKLNVKWEEIFK
jgi:hypothetical protein